MAEEPLVLSVHSGDARVGNGRASVPIAELMQQQYQGVCRTQPPCFSIPFPGKSPTSHWVSFLGVSPCEILAPALYHGYYIRPRINKQLDRGTSEVSLNDHKYEVFLDVCHFLPDELTVRTVDNLLEVVGQHPQRADRHGFISREFTRTYILPLDVDPLLMRATLSHDGILNIVAPRTGKEVKARIIEVKIIQEQTVGQEEQSEEGKGKEES